MIDPDMARQRRLPGAGCALARASLLALALLAVVAAASPAGSQMPGPPREVNPDIAPTWGRRASQARSPASAKSYMIAAANPLAVEAGLGLLRAGGSAADAAIAVQFVLNLVEPQSSGIGGGGFALHWHAAARRLQTYDGRETAPAAARPERFLADGNPIKLSEAMVGGTSVGVPGALRLLEALHKEHGKLPWPQLVQPAIRIAEQGFHVSPRLHVLLRWYGAQSFAPQSRGYFFDRTGSARAVGALLKNPEFAATLRAIAERGAGAFYEGEIAAAIVEAVRQSPTHQGDLTLADLAGYRAKEREPVCVAYRRNRICSMGPPSSGGLAIGQVLTLLEAFELGQGRGDALNQRALHLISEAQKLAFADRDLYVGDPDFVTVPGSLLDAAYLGTRRKLINPDATMGKAGPGRPPQIGSLAPGVDATVEQDGTTHFSIVDGDGNIVSMTSSIEAAFGSRLWAAGFLLNNELTDFSLRPVDRSGRPLANAVGPGKRPRSSMAPTIVFDPEGRPWAVLGSPGGSRIILYVIKTLVGLIDWKLDAQEAASLMNFGSRGGPFEIEVDHRSAVWHALRMKPYGHRISTDLLQSGAHVIVISPDKGLEGGADPRREGVARGD
jgi:gamma-glutamyltranspeptidase/glutathione hydrolase